MVMRNSVTMGIDTNIFIYYFQEHYEFGSAAKKIFQRLEKGEAKATTSIITLIELLSLKTTEENIEKLKNIYLRTPNLKTIDITQAIGIETARIRSKYGYRMADAIQLATALHLKVNVFITNDKRLQNFKEIEVRQLGI